MPTHERDQRASYGDPMRHTAEIIFLVILASAIALCLAAIIWHGHVGQQPIEAAGYSNDSVISQSGLFTTYLPGLLSWHDTAYVSPFGALMYGDVDDASGLQTMADAGSQWVSTMLHWSSVEPSKGSYDWSSFDAKAQNAQAAGMDLFVLFTGNPTWAASLPGGPVYDIQDLVNIATRMAERYDCDGTEDAPGSPCVHYWSFYAEPDNWSTDRAIRGWGYWGHNGAGFANMLSHVSPAIRAANPRAKVLIGGLAYEWFEEEGGPFVRSFLADTLRALNAFPGGARAYLDAVAFHYYPISVERWATIRDKALEVRGIMSQYGIGDLPLICPEGGYWSSPKFGSSETQQAQRLAQMYVRSLSVDVRPLSWYKVFDDAVAESAEDAYPDRTSGLLFIDGTRKASYYAYQTVARELGRAYYQRLFQWPNIEGYVFQVGSSREKTVLWSKAGSVKVSFPYSCLRHVYLLGGEESIQDGGTGDMDGTVNGAVAVSVQQDQATYIEPCN
jgi:hypothetical protein